MTQKRSRIVALVMLAAAAVFVAYALGHPEGAFPWSNTVTYTLYGLYLIVALVLLWAPFKRK